MTEVPRPEAEQTKPEPLRIFSGARVNPDGTFIKPYHQALFDLWEHETIMGRIPGRLRILTSEEQDIEPTRSLRVIPNTKKDSVTIEKIRNRFERGVSNWTRKGSPPYENISLFREAYITPLEIKDNYFRGT